MAIRNALASVAVENLQAAQVWYEQFLGAPASNPMPEVAEWTFANGGGLQVYKLAERAGSCSFTLAVDDLDAQISRLKDMHIATPKPTTNERVKVVMIKDPEGNSIAIAQALDSRLVS